MASLNKVFLMGNLTSDVQTRYTTGGRGVGEFGFAVNDKYKKDGIWVETPVFIQVTVWGKTANNCFAYLQKGSAAFIEGKLTFDSWETNEGQRRTKLAVTAQNVQFLDKKAQEQEAEIPF